MLLHPSDWAFEFVAVGGATYVVFATAKEPYRFPESEERRFLMTSLGEASETAEYVFEARSATTAMDLVQRGFVHGSKKAKDLLQYLDSMGYLIPPVDDDN